MKKRIMFKAWEKELILLMQSFLIILFTAECTDIKTEIAIKLPALLLMFINHNLLAKYTDFFKKGF